MKLTKRTWTNWVPHEWKRAEIVSIHRKSKLQTNIADLCLLYRPTVDLLIQFAQAVKDGFHRKQSILAVLIDFKAANDKEFENNC